MKCETMMQTKCWCKKNCSRTSASSNISLITERHTYFSGEKNQHFFPRSGFLLRIHRIQDSTVFQQNIKQDTCLTFRTPSRASSKLTRRIIAPDVTIWRSETGSSQTSPHLSQLLPRVPLFAANLFNNWVQGANCWELFLKRVHRDICPEFNSLQYARFSRKPHLPALHQRHCSAN